MTKPYERLKKNGVGEPHLLPKAAEMSQADRQEKQARTTESGDPAKTDKTAKPSVDE